MGILTIALWGGVAIMIETKFGAGVKFVLWFFVGGPICMLTVVWVFQTIGLSAGGSAVGSSCYQDRTGWNCD
jgi:NADH:ubiquinone oxidoreductase subunit 4 (subunit M)